SRVFGWEDHMKRVVTSFAVLMSVVAMAGVTVAGRSPSGWPIDRAHSRVTFTVTKWGFAEGEGRFLDFAGTLLYDAAHPEQSHVDWRVRIASVETGAPNRDAALKEADYFDAAHFPEMRFVSDQVRPLQPGVIEVLGRLTIRDQTKPLTVRVACGGTH